jgi:hypothetical protein
VGRGRLRHGSRGWSPALQYEELSSIPGQFMWDYWWIKQQRSKLPSRNPVNKANLVHNLLLVYLFLVCLSISTCFGRLSAHHQEKQLCFSVYATLGTCYSVRMTVWYAPFIQDQNNKYQVSHKHSYFSSCWAHSRPKHVEIDKYTKNKLCTMLALFTRLHRDALSTKHKIPSRTSTFRCQ